MNRWRMYKLGFVNFWLYDREEFSLEDGHILLRGANASGKSITTQSFIPFLLDGDKSPERLDPFGSKDRKMDFYLLGDGEREESTGYLYLEFQKDGLEEYITIGVGMRAQRGKGIDFWGFCLCDGRRIGANGVLLYETVGRQLMPLSKQKLKNLLNDVDNWAENQGSYKELVNARLFGFRDIRHYEQLIQLLIKVRTPKLSRDRAFRPTELKKLLDESLQVLTDEDLSAMVSTMERMDALEDTLKDYQAAMRDASTIRNEYNRYNLFILGLKGKAYTDARQKSERLKNQLKDAQEELARQTADLERSAQLGKQAAGLLKQAKAQRDAIGDDDITAKRSQLKTTQDMLTQHVEQLETDKARLLKLQQSIEKQEITLRARTQKQKDARAVMLDDTGKLSRQNDILQLGDEHDHYSGRLKREQATDEDHSAVRFALHRRKKLVIDQLTCLQKIEQARMAYDAACHTLDEAVTAEVGMKSELRDAQRQEQEERDRLMEVIARQQSINEELRFSEHELLSLRQAIIRYRSPADWNSVRKLTDNCYQSRHNHLLKLQLEEAQILKKLKQENEEIRRELDDLRHRPDPVPLRRTQIEATRAVLAMRGIPYAAFYETVEFRPDLPQATRDLLEAQLSDSGILDALIVSTENRSQIEELLSQYPDCFLVPGQPVADPVTDLIPDAGSRFCEIASQCLLGISGSDLGADTALLLDGRYRCGIRRGYSLAESPAGFVGATARRANWERQIQALEDRLKLSEEKLKEKQAAADELERRLSLLNQELTQMPTTDDLDQALDMLSQAQQKVMAAEAEVKKRTEDEQAAKFQLSKLEQESRELSQGLPYARTMEEYEAASEAAEEYANLITILIGDCNTLQYTMDSVIELTESIGEQRDHADEVNRLNQRKQQTIDIYEAQIRGIQDFLNRPENQERARRLAELDCEIERQERQHKEAHDACIKLEVIIQNAKQSVERHNQELLKTIMDEHEYEKYFSEDLALGLTIAKGDMNLEQCARVVWSKVQPSDRERTPEKVGEALRNNYQQHNNSLLKYHPKIETIFDAPAQPAMRQRLEITLQKDGKELSLYEFMTGLQRDIDTTMTVLEESDRTLFEDILTETISHKLRARIEESQQWSRNMTDLMKTLNTSMGLQFSLDWKPKKAEGSEELDTAQLVTLLNKDKALLTREDSQRVSTHFRAKIKALRQNNELQDQTLNYADLIRAVLDYRTWYEFHLYFQREGEGKKELTDRIFNKFSGGEKAMAMYLPQFAAVSAQYQKGSPSCPMLLALDEAFAGVDDKNISAMFELVHILQFDYIMNSQALWGCYPCVSSLDIAEFYRPANAQVVTILRYRWNGAEKILLED